MGARLQAGTQQVGRDPQFEKLYYTTVFKHRALQGTLHFLLHTIVQYFFAISLVHVKKSGGYQPCDVAVTELLYIQIGQYSYLL